MQASNLRPGQGVRMDGKVYVITGIEHRTPGNLRAFVQLKYRDVLKGLTNEKRFAPTAEMELVDLDRREMEYLYSDNTGATFMDGETYEQYVLNEGVLGDALLFLKPNTKAIVLMQDGNPLMIELPPHRGACGEGLPSRGEGRDRDEPAQGRRDGDGPEDPGARVHQDRRDAAHFHGDAGVPVPGLSVSLHEPTHRPGPLRGVLLFGVCGRRRAWAVGMR
jgi:translation elongation factor P/translation initiation factor 5A